ncbi:MAG TPA: DUF2851 family protein [Bacteroidetes bacterium]|nr:DUF2851 family protein [Bacteroidota bacterium]
MNEQFLQFIWKNALFEPREGKLSTGEYIIIRKVGNENHDAGPDFNNARIIIDGTLWVGNVEIHIRSSDWYRHGHHQDPVYENVILHVVYEHDRDTHTLSGRNVPVFSLNVPAEIYGQYYALMNHKGWIPCAAHLSRIDPLALDLWLRELLEERMEKKAAGIRNDLAQTRGDWEEVFYHKLMRAYGNPVNAEPFERLARSVPWKVVLKHRDSLKQLEALLFGQAGMLENESFESYAQELNKEYHHLAGKYQLKPLPASVWHYARLRPVHFPPVRMAQLAALFHRRPHLFRNCLEMEDMKGITDMFRVEPSAYWSDHYRFGVASPAGKKWTGEVFMKYIISNVIIPFRYAYAAFHGKEEGKQKALKMLEQQPPEKHRITRNWEKLGLPNDHAAASQALIHLKKEYCIFKKCLNCHIGRMILTG